jgi:hypothetical protein
MKGARIAMNNKKRTFQRIEPPKLRFSPTAWAKLLFLRDAGETEICGFGVAAPNDLLLVEDVRLVNQVCTAISAELDDASVAEYFDEQVDRGWQPSHFARLFLHTHPGSSPQPSTTDEETFARVFGNTDWAVMFILAQQGQCYARLRCNTGPGIEVEIPVEVDYGRPFEATDWNAWQEEYEANVHGPPAQVIDESTAKDGMTALRADDEVLYRERWLDPWDDRWADYEDFERELINDYHYE